MPGSVRVAPSSDRHAQHQAQVEQERDVGEHAEQPVEHHHEDDDERRRRRRWRARRHGWNRRRDRDRRCAPRGWSSAPAARPARSSSARSLADCTVKLPEMMPLPPMIGSRITGALITLLSSTMANGLPTFSRVASAKRRAPDRVEFEADDRLVVAGRWAGRRSACRRRPSPAGARHRPGRRRGGHGRLGRQELVAGRQPAAPASSAEALTSTSWNVSFAVLPSSDFDALGIVDPGQLDEDAVIAFALDGRLLGAGLVDAAADDLDRLVDRLAGARFRSPARWRGWCPRRRPRSRRSRSGSIFATIARASSIRAGSRS